MRAIGSIAIVFALSACFAFIGLAVLRTPDLESGVRQALLRGLASSSFGDDLVSEGGIELVTVNGPPSDAVRGAQILFLGVLLGGFPMAMIGVTLAWVTRIRQQCWSDAWVQVFVGGFAFQFSSLCATLLFFLATLASAVMEWSIDEGDALRLGAFSISLGCSVVSLSSWRALRRSVSEQVSRVVP